MPTKNPEGQAAIAPLLEGVRLIVVDNISTLCRTNRKRSDSWIVVQMWALSNTAPDGLCCSLLMLARLASAC